MASYLKVSKWLLNVRLFCLPFKCSISSSSIRPHHYPMTFGFLAVRHFCLEARSCGIKGPHRWLPPLPSQRLTHPLPYTASSSPVSQPASSWVTALSATRKRGETEQVQSHLVIYRQPAFSPRDLIITWPAERTTEACHTHTHTHTPDCMLLEKSAHMFLMFAQYRHVWPFCPPTHTYREIRGWQCKEKPPLQCSTHRAKQRVTPLSIHCLYSGAQLSLRVELHRQTDTKGEQMQPSKSRRQQSGGREVLG